MSKVPIQYILVRKDLPFPIQMVQACHAAGESIQVAPISSATTIRLLHVDNEEVLRAFHEKLISKSYRAVLIQEPDPPYNNQAMALGIEPLTERVSGLGRMFYHLEPAR